MTVGMQAFLGFPEIIAIAVVMAFMAAVGVGLVVLIVWLVGRNRK